VRPITFLLLVTAEHRDGRVLPSPLEEAKFGAPALASKKKADVAGHPEVSHHVGLLVDGPPGGAGLPFI
jgi:hypothetical protein